MNTVNITNLEHKTARTIEKTIDIRRKVTLFEKHLCGKGIDFNPMLMISKSPQLKKLLYTWSLNPLLLLLEVVLDEYPRFIAGVSSDMFFYIRAVVQPTSKNFIASRKYDI